MKTDRLIETLSAKKRGYADVVKNTVDVIGWVNDLYYIGRKFQLKRQKDGSVTLTERKNGTVVVVEPSRVLFATQGDSERFVVSDYVDVETVIRTMKSANNGYFPFPNI